MSIVASLSSVILMKKNDYLEEFLYISELWVLSILDAITELQEEPLIPSNFHKLTLITILFALHSPNLH
jgi:hypothetical protein